MKNKKVSITRSLIIEKKKNNFFYSIKKIPLKKLKDDEVIIKVKYSCFNYKDILVGKGNPGLVRKYPHVPGIDCTGEIYQTNSKNFNIGDKVMVIARPVGINSMGTMTDYFIVSSKCVEKIPNDVNIKLPIIFGTAGFTAMLAINNIRNLKIDKKRSILITGATGGVGLFSIFFLKKYGYKIVAATTSIKKNKKKLIQAGANEVINYENILETTNLPLLKEKYGAIIDNVGGDIFSTCLKFLCHNGVLISVGNVISNHSNMNILPLILRQVKVFGVNAENTNSIVRKKIWKNIFNFKNNKNLIKFFMEYN
uniref:zinc-binding dehydrogenase n=1 Tax=Candidatus Pelagibacter sp. TaxID=2024849 RepID=UPI003F877BBE